MTIILFLQIKILTTTSGKKDYGYFFKILVVAHPACSKKLESMHDFQAQKSNVEGFVKTKGHKAIFLPKFHCELSPVELEWGEAKCYMHANCNHSFSNLRKLFILH